MNFLCDIEYISAETARRWLDHGRILSSLRCSRNASCFRNGRRIDHRKIGEHEPGSGRYDADGSGLTLTIFGTGFAQFVGEPLLGSSVPSDITSFFAKLSLPLLGDIPVIGPIFFQQDIFVYISYIVCALAAVYMYKTKIGMNLKAVGESNAAADASGINVALYKYVHILIGGALCGLGGAYLSLVRMPIWQENIVNGRGWIAVALVIFVAWNPIKGFFGGALFGGLSILGLKLQAMGVGVSQYLVDMIPYVATILIVIFSTYKKKKESQPPADLGNNYFREER